MTIFNQIKTMKHTKEQYQEALEKAAIHSEGWEDNTDSMCQIRFTCPTTGYE